jgi:energy-coupling factor transporter ATP-binding protein EcfA2
VLEAVEDVAKRIARIGNQEISASSWPSGSASRASRQWTPVGDLSGGERRRLQLLRLLMAEPNVLLLDEPTNDLDIDTLTALEDLLDGWPGTLLVVSHDRYFVERVCDSVVALLGDGSLAALPGGVEEYLRVHPLPAGRGQRDQYPALIPGVGFPADQVRGGEPVDPVRHGAGGDQGGAEQGTRRELERRSLPAQRRQHVELPRFQPVLGERAAPRDVQVPGQPGDPAEHLHRLDVQIGPLGPPRGDQVVHFVAEQRLDGDIAVGIRPCRCLGARSGALAHY